MGHNHKFRMRHELRLAVRLLVIATSTSGFALGQEVNLPRIEAPLASPHSLPEMTLPPFSLPTLPEIDSTSPPTFGTPVTTDTAAKTEGNSKTGRAATGDCGSLECCASLAGERPAFAPHAHLNAPAARVAIRVLGLHNTHSAWNSRINGSLPAVAALSGATGRSSNDLQSADAIPEVAQFTFDGLPSIPDSNEPLLASMQRDPEGSAIPERILHASDPSESLLDVEYPFPSSHEHDAQTSNGYASVRPAAPLQLNIRPTLLPNLPATLDAQGQPRTQPPSERQPSLAASSSTTRSVIQQAAAPKFEPSGFHMRDDSNDGAETRQALSAVGKAQPAIVQSPALFTAAALEHDAFNPLPSNQTSPRPANSLPGEISNASVASSGGGTGSSIKFTDTPGLQSLAPPFIPAPQARRTNLETATPIAMQNKPSLVQPAKPPVALTEPPATRQVQNAIGSVSASVELASAKQPAPLNQIHELNRTVKNAFPKSRVEIAADTEGLIIQGIAASESEAKKIVSFVRKSTLVPVTDRVVATR